MEVLKEKIRNVGLEKSKVQQDIENLKSNLENFLLLKI